MIRPHKEFTLDLDQDFFAINIISSFFFLEDKPSIDCVFASCINTIPAVEVHEFVLDNMPDLDNRFEAHKHV